LIRPRDVVKLKADDRTFNEAELLYVMKVETTCDGTGGDGAGVLCAWWNGNEKGYKASWLSESSLTLVATRDVH